ncbi:MAG: hypothetical protein KatS3mg002_0562 [Candidatus Woesearchaeota archaeon]|nr:MAG: hypothetical protein KatS3mg002_0562 [Candidatus Woesearchaeota archaeon]
MLEKELSIFNPSDDTEYVTISYEQEKITFNIKKAVIINGPFAAYNENNILKVHTAYSLKDVVPIKIRISETGECLEFVSKDNMPLTLY